MGLDVARAHDAVDRLLGMLDQVERAPLRTDRVRLHLDQLGRDELAEGLEQLLHVSPQVPGGRRQQGLELGIGKLPRDEVYPMAHGGFIDEARPSARACPGLDITAQLREDDPVHGAILTGNGGLGSRVRSSEKHEVPSLRAGHRGQRNRRIESHEASLAPHGEGQ